MGGGAGQGRWAEEGILEAGIGAKRYKSTGPTQKQQEVQLDGQKVKTGKRG